MHFSSILSAKLGYGFNSQADVRPTSIEGWSQGSKK
jgi:hypothetical protein